MKRATVLLTFILMLSLFVGCGKGETQVAPAQSDGAASSAQAAGSALSTGATELGRSPAQELTFLLEGTQETVPATLFLGQGYSLYIPDQGWRYERDAEDAEDTWEAVENEDVELEIRFFAGSAPEKARSILLREYEDYGFMDPDENGNFLGVDGADSETMEVRMKTSPEGVFAILLCYPDEAAEGFGVRLGAIADTFETEVESLAE